MRVLRYPIALAAASFLLLATMLLLEFLYFRPLTGGLTSLELRFTGFKAVPALQYLTALGPGGREALLVWHYLTLDLAFPPVLTLTFASFTVITLKRVPALSRALHQRFGRRRVEWLVLLWVSPYLLADYGQNLMVAAMLVDPTGASHKQIEWASILIQLKFIFGAVGTVVIVALHLMRDRSHPAP